jgi:hypothetical protein
MVACVFSPQVVLKSRQFSPAALELQSMPLSGKVSELPEEGIEKGFLTSGDNMVLITLHESFAGISKSTKKGQDGKKFLYPPYYSPTWKSDKED